MTKPRRCPQAPARSSDLLDYFTWYVRTRNHDPIMTATDNLTTVIDDGWMVEITAPGASQPGIVHARRVIHDRLVKHLPPCTCTVEEQCECCGMCHPGTTCERCTILNLVLAPIPRSMKWSVV